MPREGASTTERAAIAEHVRTIAQAHHAGQVQGIVVDKCHTVVQWGHDWCKLLAQLE